jgi:hypothetical protein
MTENWKKFAGKMSDRELGKRFGVGSSTVRRYRLKHAIPVHDHRDAAPPPRRVCRSS